MVVHLSHYADNPESGSTYVHTQFTHIDISVF